VDEWNQAEINWPIGPGDRIFTDNDSRAEIQMGQTYLRIGPGSDVTLTEDTPYSISIGVAQGVVHVHCLGLWSGQSLHLNTPSGSAGLDQPGEMRVEVYAGEQASVFAALANQVLVTGAGGFYQEIYSGQALELVGSNPVYPQWLEPATADNLDLWSAQRDRQIALASSYRYVSPEIPGGEELDAYGTWRPVSEYGPIWFPDNVPAGWAPYHYGHWVNHEPWGWVWVEQEPWGYAPFHYGRWVNYNGRWGWIPGPREVHPVWSPALVVFAGGIRAGGFGLSVWFPLGPGEPYHPWYPCSSRYVDQVNITNIAESQRVHVQKTYVNINVTNITYVNRTVGASAMRQDDFAAGRPAHQASVQVDANLVNHPQILERPQVEANKNLMAAHPPIRSVPVQAQRPALINEKGMMVVAKPGAQPVAAPVKTAPAVNTLPGRTVAAPPSTARGAAAKTPSAPANSMGNPASTPGTGPAGRQTSEPTAQPTRNPAPTPGTGPAGRQTSEPTAQPTRNPAPGASGWPANQPQSKTAPGAGAQPATEPARGTAAEPVNKPAAQPENRPWPESTNQPGTRQPQAPTANPAPESGTKPSQGTEAKPGAGPAGGSSAQPGAKPAPPGKKQGEQKQGEEKQGEKNKSDQEKQDN
jgi:hypothetical protein